MDFGLLILSYLGTAVFAISGAMLGLRKELDIVGVTFVATLTGIGGGTMRDLLLGATPVGWVQNPTDLIICFIIAILACLIHKQLINRKMISLLYADAAGLSLFAVLGTAKALTFDAHPVVAILFGAMSASFGGIVRDVMMGEQPVIFQKEIYISAALLSGLTYVGMGYIAPFETQAMIAIIAGLSLRVLAMTRGWSLAFPKYKP